MKTGQTKLVKNPDLPEVSDTSRKREAVHDTDWRLAFVLLTKVVASGFISSDNFNQYVLVIQEHCGEEAAKVMVAIFNQGRSKFMQEFMG